MKGKHIAIIAAASAGAAVAYAAWRWRRIASQEIERLADLLGWHEGRVVADVGAGGGAMAFQAAERVGPSGRVFASEIDPRKVERIRKRAAKRGLANVTVVAAGEHDSGLPPASCDAILLRGSYHHFSDPEGLNASLYRALRPGGTLVALDFAPRSWLTAFLPVKNVPANRGGHGIPRELLVHELVDAGFEVGGFLPKWFWDIYGVLFRKPAEA